VPGTALHLLTSADHQYHESNPLNSARLSLHSLHFVTLSFRSVGSAVQRKRNQVGASLRSRSLRARMPTDDDLHWPQPLTGHHAMPGDLNRVALKSPVRGVFCSLQPRGGKAIPAHCKPSSTCAGRTRFIPPLLREYATRCSMKRPAPAPERAERLIRVLSAREEKRP